MANEILLHKTETQGATLVANSFIDTYMTSANGEYVKVYLYLLRCMNAPDRTFSISKIADLMENTEKDICRALGYWEKMNLLRLEYDANGNLAGVYLNSILKTSETGTSEGGSTMPVTSSTSSARTVPKRPAYAPSQIQAKLREHSELAEVVFVAEQYLKRTLNAEYISTILYWFEELSFRPELIVYLLEYSVTNKKSSLREMNELAISWYTHNIKTEEQAVRFSKTAPQPESRYNARMDELVIRGFGLNGRSLTEHERSFVRRWCDEYQSAPELVIEACERTIQKIHQPGFEYADRILSNWHAKNARTLEDVATLDLAFSRQQSERKTARNTQQTKAKANDLTKSAVSNNKFNNFSQRSYDYTELEHLLLKQTLQ